MVAWKALNGGISGGLHSYNYKKGLFHYTEQYGSIYTRVLLKDKNGVHYVATINETGNTGEFRLLCETSSCNVDAGTKEWINFNETKFSIDISPLNKKIDGMHVYRLGSPNFN